MRVHPAETPSDLIPATGFVIEFPDVSPARASQYAGDLETTLKDAVTDAGVDADVQRIRTNPETQDLGTVLAIVLGAKATIAIAYGIAKWLSRPNASRVLLRTQDGRTAELTNLNSGDVEGAIKSLSSATR